MEAGPALEDLLAASPEVEAAAVFGDGDEPLGSVGGPDGWARTAARASRALLEAANGLRGVGEATQVHAALAGGDVFLVRSHAGPAILAVTSEPRPAGLVFHDLKRCLASIAESPE